MDHIVVVKPILKKTSKNRYNGKYCEFGSKKEPSSFSKRKIKFNLPKDHRETGGKFTG